MLARFPLASEEEMMELLERVGF